MTNYQSKYPLLPYSQLVWEMTRWIPGLYGYPAILRWKNGVKEKDRIEKAIRMALENHPVFSMRVDCIGRQYRIIQKDILHGDYHDVDIYIEDDDLWVKMCGNLILGDSKSLQVLIEDIIRAHNGQLLEEDDYWGYVARYEQNKTTPHYKASHDWLIKEFEDESVPVHPTIDRRWLPTILPPKAGIYTDDYTSIQKQINGIESNYYLTLDGLFSLCAALAIAEYCGTDAAALTWAYEGRETSEEQRIYGSLHRDVPFHIRKSKIENRESAIQFARNQIRSGIVHSDYPYTLMAPYNQRWNYAVNVLRVPELNDYLSLSPYPIEITESPIRKYAYALLDVEIHEHTDSIRIWYTYSSTHYKPESIRRFAALVRKYVEWLVD